MERERVFHDLVSGVQHFPELSAVFEAVAGVLISNHQEIVVAGAGSDFAGLWTLPTVRPTSRVYSDVGPKSLFHLEMDKSRSPLEDL